jgi:hypothetical protein
VPDRRDTPFAPVNGDPRQYFFINPANDFDPFPLHGEGTSASPAKIFRAFLRTVRPTSSISSTRWRSATT